MSRPAGWQVDARGPVGPTGPLVVIGDVLLDVDLTGTANRLCPDDPAPVLDDVVESARPGGAGLAALLASRQLRPVWLVTALGADEPGERVSELLDPHVRLLASRTAGRTVVKTRVRSNARTLARLDRGPVGDDVRLDPHVAMALPGLLDGAAAVLVSDYGLGLTRHPAVRDQLARVAADIPVVWDPHPRGAPPVPGTALATPNGSEAATLSGIPGNRLGAAVAQARALASAWRCGHVAVTRGASGAVVCSERGNPLVVPVARPASGDPCGAGDAFAVGAAHAMADGLAADRAVQVGVERAGEFLHGGGVATWRAHDGAQVPAVAPGPARDSEPDAAAVVARVRRTGGTVVMAGGCFDLLHAGHVAYLEAARSLGDCLVVAMNSDASVRRLKGPERPVVPEADRARLLAALRCVDAIVVFDQPTPAGVLESLRPDIFAKGGDYVDAPIPEADVVAAHGGQVVALPTLVGRSSTRLLQAARATTQIHITEEEPCRTTTTA